MGQLPSRGCHHCRNADILCLLVSQALIIPKREISEGDEVMRQAGR
jgi:hypothetical protein